LGAAAAWLTVADSWAGRRAGGGALIGWLRERGCPFALRRRSR